MKLQVTGAAGDVGATVVSALLDNGDEVVGLDDLSRGQAGFLDRTPHAVGDIADPRVLGALFAHHRDLAAVVHCAARTIVEESVTEPLTYSSQNVDETLPLLEFVLQRRCRRIILSSLCACRPPRIVTESALVEAVSPYAATKLMIERELDDVAAAGLARTVLRYFNPVGADPQLHAGRTDPDSPDMLSALLAAAAAGRPFVVNGTDCDAVGCRADITRAAELLGRRPITGLDDAVRDALRWVATLPPPTGMTA